MMKRFVTTGRALLVVLASVLLGSCAAGELDEIDAGSCDTFQDCPLQQQCVDGRCVTPDDGGPTGRDTSDPNGPDTDGSGPDTGTPPNDSAAPNDTGTPPGDTGTSPDTATPSDTGVAPDTGTTMDTGPAGCGGSCGLGETCDNGTCVSKCQPACRSDQQCADLGQGPECHDTCPEALKSDGCLQNGELCRDIDRDPNDQKETLVCVQSQCSDHSDCQNGTCLHFVNDYGACINTGPKKIGEACDTSQASQLCEKGAFCVRTSATGSAGICRRLCDPWNSSGQCSSNEHCSLMNYQNGTFNILTFRQGFCNPSVDPNGTSSLDTCSSPDNMCNDGVRCFSGGSSNFCFKWCRPGRGDCVGSIPQQYMASGVCDNYLFAGERRIGRCVPQCSGTRFCSASGTQCDNKGICRSSCSAGSVVQDCCNGQTPCDWSCNNGLCE